MLSLRKYSISLAFGLGVALMAMAACKEPKETGDGEGGGGDDVASSSGGGNVHADRCEQTCRALADSGCDYAPSYDGCMFSCLTLSSADACSADADNYFDCTERVDVQCDGAGDPYHPGCGDEWLVAIGCAVTENPNPAMEQPCDDYCNNMLDASCPNSNTYEGCNISCHWLGADGNGCDDEWLSYLACANDANWSCLLSFPTPEACGEPFTAYYACLDAVGN